MGIPRSGKTITSIKMAKMLNYNYVAIDTVYEKIAEELGLITISLDKRKRKIYSITQKGMKYCDEWHGYVEGLKSLGLGELVVTKLRKYTKPG